MFTITGETWINCAYQYLYHKLDTGAVEGVSVEMRLKDRTQSTLLSVFTSPAPPNHLSLSPMDIQVRTASSSNCVSVWNGYARQQEWKPLIGGKQGSPLLFGVYATLQTNRSACHCGIFLPICPLPTPFTNLLSITSIYQGQLLVKWDQR